MFYVRGAGAVLNVFEIYFELRFATSQDVKAGVNLKLGVAPGAVLSAFEIYFELRFATSHGREGWGLIRTPVLRHGWLQLSR